MAPALELSGASSDGRRCGRQPAPDATRRPNRRRRLATGGCERGAAGATLGSPQSSGACHERRQRPDHLPTTSPAPGRSILSIPRSTGVRQDGEDYVLDGELTLKAISKPISLHLEIEAVLNP